MKQRSKAEMALTVALLAGGLGAIGYGLWLTFPPAAWVFGGFTSLMIAVWPAPRPAKKVAAK